MALGAARFGVALALTFVAACGASNKEAPAAPETPTPGAIVVQERLAPDYKAVSAILTNRDVGDARARISGVLQQILVREGDTVRRGQLLAVVVDQRLSLEAQAGAANVGAAEAAAERARADLARVQTLFDRGFYAQARLDAAQAEARAADAQLRAARAQASAAAAMSHEGAVVAAARGRVTRLPIPQGAVVLPGDVIVAVSTGARVLRIELPESEAGALRQGQNVEILGEDDGAQRRTARVRQVYPSIENGRVTADLDATNFEGDFVGARVRVLVPTGEQRAFIIPQAYIITRFGVDYVRLAQPGGVIEAPVQLGGRVPLEDMPDGVEILSGLREGDRVLPPETGA